MKLRKKIGAHNDSLGVAYKIRLELYHLFTKINFSAHSHDYHNDVD